jgi:hypothetical protein
MRELVEAFRKDEGAGDIYLVAQNQLLRHVAFQMLWEDMVFDPEWFDVEKARTHTSLWMGPRGSITPFHYDLQNALLAQVFGTKSIILAAPEETEMLYPGSGGYSRIDPENPDVETFPLALTDSISLTLAGFPVSPSVPKRN